MTRCKHGSRYPCGECAPKPEPFTCPGRAMPQPADAPYEGYVACYRAGHACPPFVSTVTVDATHRTVTYRCPCCGDHGSTICTPHEWGDVQVPADLRGGVVLESEPTP